METKEMIIVSLLVWNTFIFLIYAFDKYKAARRQWRIPEASLILLAFAGGGLGALLGMYGIRHKTRNMKFKLLVPMAFLIQAAVLVWVMNKLGK